MTASYNSLTHCATLLGDNIGNKTTYVITLYFNFYFNKQYVTTGSVQYHLKTIQIKANFSAIRVFSARTLSFYEPIHPLRCT